MIANATFSRIGRQRRVYLTAQRVRAPRGATGVNVALYHHTQIELPEELWTLSPDKLIQMLSTEYPRQRVTAEIAVPPGMNSIQSFLDVVAPDRTALDTIKGSLNNMRTVLTKVLRNASREGKVTAEFCVNNGALNIETEFNELVNAALALYSNPSPPAWYSIEPLTIEVERDEEASYYTLTQESQQRVVTAGGHPARIRVGHDAANDFRSLVGPMYPHVAQWVTNIPQEQLLKLGGAKFFFESKCIGEWPKRQ